MTIDFVSLIFIWLLPRTASNAVTSGQDNNFTDVMTGTQITQNKFTRNQLTTQEMSSLKTISEASGHNVTQSMIVNVNPTEEKATTTVPPKTLSSGIQTAATPTNSILSQLNSTTVGMNPTTEIQSKVTTSATEDVTSHASIPTTTTWVPSMPRSSTQSQFSSDKMTNLSTRRTQSTNLISSTTTSTKAVETKSTSSSPVTGDAMQSTGLYKTTMVTTKTPFIHMTEAKERQDPPGKNAKSNKGTNHSKAVAGLIGGALVFMMLGFLVIYIKKRKLQRQQITTTDWAGPSPFLEDGADNGQVTLRSSNRISFSSFLPQRLSKRLSLLPDADKELEDMTQGTTFGDKHQENTFGREVDGNDVQKNNGTAVVVPEMKSTGDAPETVENSVSVPASQTNDPLYKNNNLEVANHSQGHSANPPTLSESVENPLAQLNDGSGQT